MTFNGFGPFMKKGRRKKSFEYLGEFSDFGRLDLITILKEEFEEVGFMKLIYDLKSLNFI